jgi:cellulose synthase/poly-beta-1,6-N-acetylglucosamine synthase-like glycosyltransferase
MNAGTLTAVPTVSIILPTHTERRFIRDCLDSIAAQDYPAICEALVLDGGSLDGTRAIVTSMGAPFTLIENPGVTAAAALNLGIARASGEVIVRMDAHALYAPDYVRRCVEVLVETGADNVGGRMRATGRSAFGRAVAAITSSKLGVGPGKFHYSEERADVDTVFLGCWKRNTLVELDGFDEHGLQWAAEDHELNMRLRAKGGRIVLDPRIVSHYFPRESRNGLARQYRNYGMGKVSTLVKHRTLPSPRPLAPAALVAVSAAAFLFGRGPARVAVPVIHGVVCAAVARGVAGQPGVDAPRAFVAIEICHWSYGIGFWAGVGRVLLRRPFDARPVAHR